MSKYTPLEIKAARIMCQREADQCRLNRDDSWNLYSEEFKADAKAILDGCGVPDLLVALETMSAEFDHGDVNDGEWAAIQKARAAIAKVNGERT